MPKISSYPDGSVLQNSDKLVIARAGKNYSIPGSGVMLFDEDVLAADFALTAASGVYEDVGIEITLPGAGNYEISALVRASLQGNAGTAWWISARFYNTTDGAEVTNSARLCVLTNNNTLLFQQTTMLKNFITVAAAKTIKLQAFRKGSGAVSWTTSTISSDINGVTNISYRN